ncbi:MAG: hypothetical protein IJM20_06725 [Clostridia bacterium]|nr:hypothetical protein [Clostridia bacterium]
MTAILHHKQSTSAIILKPKANVKRKSRYFGIFEIIFFKLLHASSSFLRKNQSEHTQEKNRTVQLTGGNALQYNKEVKVLPRRSPFTVENGAENIHQEE